MDFLSLFNRSPNAHPQDWKQFGPQAGPNAQALQGQTALPKRRIEGDTNQRAHIKSIVTH